MMCIPKREEIIPLLIQLEKDVKQDPKRWFIQDNKLPSLYLWEMQFKYLKGVMDLFEGAEENANLLKVYDELKIDDFFIKASAIYDESKRKLEKYIEDSKKVLNIE